MTREIEQHRQTREGTLEDIREMIGLLGKLSGVLEEAINTHPDVTVFDQLLYKIAGALVNAVMHYKAQEAALLAEASRATIH
jgi:hypothetical protein